MRRYLCRWLGHRWRHGGTADTGMCMASIHECLCCGYRSDRWPPR